MRALKLLPVLMIGGMTPVMADDGVQLCHVANAGFYMEGKSAAAIIDGVILEPHRSYPAATEALTRKIMAGEGRFAKLKVATISHYHGDHYDPRAAEIMMDQNPDVAWLVTPQARDMLERHADITGATLPEWEGPKQSYKFDGVKLDYWRVSHGRDEIENLGVKITIDGVSFFHPGDISTDATQLLEAGLNREKVDVLLVPYWFGPDDGDDMQTLKAALDWRIAVPMHYGRPDLSWIKDAGGLEKLRKTAPAGFSGGVDLFGEMKCMTIEAPTP